MIILKPSIISATRDNPTKLIILWQQISKNPPNLQAITVLLKKKIFKVIYTLVLSHLKYMFTTTLKIYI